MVEAPGLTPVGSQLSPRSRLMNKILAAIGVLAVGGGLSICDVCGATHSAVAAKSAPQVARVAHAAEIRIVTFKVEGMTCGGCVFGVRRVLTRLAGVCQR